MKAIHSGFILSLSLLIVGTFFGVLGSVVYYYPAFLKGILGFEKLRPLHVSSVVFWIIIAASTAVLISLHHDAKKQASKTLCLVQTTLWVLVIAAVYFSYGKGYFGGREYWEFPPIISILVSVVWLLFIYRLLKVLLPLKSWPVYYWMWCTGAFFFLFELMENYLWLIPYFRQNYITDATIQWKANGSLVGAWNQLVYGLAFYLTDRISGDKNTGRSKLAFAMYFLGLFNLMFNWGHHIYTLPTSPYIRYIGYTVSMTEWIFFIRIIHNWKKTLQFFRLEKHRLALRFMMASEFWVALNLLLAIFMSIPAINLYTHGTHITVAHAMGTTIGINTMILLGIILFHVGTNHTNQIKKLLTMSTISLCIFWILLIIAGIMKSAWQMSPHQKPYGEMMNRLKPLFICFSLSGIVLAISLSGIAFYLMRGMMERGKTAIAKNGDVMVP